MLNFKFGKDLVTSIFGEMLFLMANQLSKLAFQKLEQKQIVLKQKKVEKQLTFYKNHLEKRELVIHEHARICLEITDTGKGMDTHTIKRIFDLILQPRKKVKEPG
ncbi:hypothetical protein [Desulfocicer niacini]